MENIDALLNAISRIPNEKQRNQAIINIFVTNSLETMVNKGSELSAWQKRDIIADKQKVILDMIDSEELVAEILEKYSSQLSPQLLEGYLNKIKNQERKSDILKKIISKKNVNELIELIEKTNCSKYYCNIETLNEELRKKSETEYLNNPTEYIRAFRESIFDQKRNDLRFISSAITIYNNSESEKVKEEVKDILSTYIKHYTNASDEQINVFNQKLFQNEINTCRIYDLETAEQLEFACIMGEIFDKKQLRGIDLSTLDLKRLQECTEKVNEANKNEEVISTSRLEAIMKLYNLKRASEIKREDVSTIGTNDNIQYGIELEFKGLYYNQFQIYVNTVMADESIQDDIGLTDAEKEALKRLKDWNICEDAGVFGGTEFKSDILKDTQENWEEISTACKVIESMGGYIDKDCYFHVHIDAGALGIDSKAWEIYYRMQQQNEEIIKKISCPIGERNRSDNDIWSKDIKDEDIIGAGVRIETEEDLLEFAKRASLAKSGRGFDREKRINILGIVRGDKYTIEDRGAHGIVKYNDIRNGITKSVRMIELAKRISVDKEFAETNRDLIQTMLHSPSESKRKDALINLAFGEDERAEFLARYDNYPNDDRNNPGIGEL